MARTIVKEKVVRGSRNVFADLGFENPEDALVKAALVRSISKAIKAKSLTQAKVAAMIGLDQPQVSKLLRGRTAGYSTDRLLRILVLLGQDIEIRVTPKPSKSVRKGHLVVTSSHEDAARLFVKEPTAQFPSAKKKRKK